MYFGLTKIIEDYGLTIDTAARQLYEIEIIDIYTFKKRQGNIYLYVQTGFPIDSDFVNLYEEKEPFFFFF